MKYLNLVIYISLISSLLLLSCGKKEKEQKKTVTPEMLLEMNRRMVKAEGEIINKFIKDNKLTMQVSETGLRYNIVNTNEEFIKPGDIVTLKYTTSLLDSTVCYSSEKNGLMHFSVGKGHVESGLEEAVLMMGKGSKASLILPPYLAHGLAGDGNKIPKLAILMMDIEVIDIQREVVSSN